MSFSVDPTKEALYRAFDLDDRHTIQLIAGTDMATAPMLTVIRRFATDRSEPWMYVMISPNIADTSTRVSCQLFHP